MVSDQELFQELFSRFEKDQKLCKEGPEQEYFENCHNNSLWLKKIVSQKGWLSQDLVGVQGERCAWLIAQHSDDLEFQKHCLCLLKELPETKERDQHIAYLTDRILVREGKNQLYGTQFSDDKPFLIHDELGLDERRAKMGLCSFKEYCLLLRKK